MNKQYEITKKAIARLDAIEKEQAALRKIIEQPELEEWLPKTEHTSLDHYIWSAPEWLKGASKDEKQLVLAAWLQAFRNEFYPDWSPDWKNKSQNKYLIKFCHEDKSLDTIYWHVTETLGAVNMPEECAEKFVQMYEAGQIDLSWYFGGDV